MSGAGSYVVIERLPHGSEMYNGRYNWTKKDHFKHVNSKAMFILRSTPDEANNREILEWRLEILMSYGQYAPMFARTYESNEQWYYFDMRKAKWFTCTKNTIKSSLYGEGPLPPPAPHDKGAPSGGNGVPAGAPGATSGAPAAGAAEGTGGGGKGSAADMTPQQELVADLVSRLQQARLDLDEMKMRKEAAENKLAASEKSWFGGGGGRSSAPVKTLKGAMCQLGDSTKVVVPADCPLITNGALTLLKEYEYPMEVQKVGGTCIPDQWSVCAINYNVLLQTTRKELEQSRRKVADLELRVNEVTSRMGRGHIQRDTTSNVDNGFPNGEDLIQQFSKATISLHMFLEECADFLGDLLGVKGELAAAPYLAEDVLLPIYRTCQQWVRDELNRKIMLLNDNFRANLSVAGEEDNFNERVSIPELFWLLSQQSSMVHYVENMDFDEVLQLLNAAGSDGKGLPAKLHDKMVELNQTGETAYGSKDQEFTFLTLVRLFLRFMVVGELSDPRVRLEPAPGAVAHYNPSHHTEVLSGTRSHGRIQEGDEVRVLFPGIVFVNAPTEAPASDAASSPSAHPKNTIKCKALVFRENAGARNERDDVLSRLPNAAPAAPRSSSAHKAAKVSAEEVARADELGLTPELSQRYHELVLLAADAKLFEAKRSEDVARCKRLKAEVDAAIGPPGAPLHAHLKKFRGDYMKGDAMELLSARIDPFLATLSAHVKYLFNEVEDFDKAPLAKEVQNQILEIKRSCVPPAPVPSSDTYPRIKEVVPNDNAQQTVASSSSSSTGPTPNSATYPRIIEK